jgi:hypothetical protein
MARSEGEKQASVNNAEGRRAELINRSEGEMQRRINEAEGQAAEILAIGQATAESIQRLAAALCVPGGTDAMRLQLGQRYLSRLGSLARPGTQVVLPADLTHAESLLEGLGLPRGDQEPADPTQHPTRTLVSPAAFVTAADPVPARPRQSAGPPPSLRQRTPDEEA